MPHPSARALLACFALFVSIAAQIPPALPQVPETAGYTDIETAGVHRPAIEALLEAGVLVGAECGSGRFCPNQPLPRWLMAVWIVRALGEGRPPTGGVSAFADVAENRWWAPYVNRLRELGITHGCQLDPAHYCPNQTVTRAQMAGFLARGFNLGSEFAFDFGDRGALRFVDTSANPHAFEIEVMARAGVTAGCATDPYRFCPHQPVTRGEMATFLARALNLVPVVEHIEDVGGRGFLHLVSEYTTFYSCCSARVINIQRMADLVDGAAVPPGHEFSLNRHVGRRTYRKGFVTADTLVNGRLVGSVGGGVSQFATTLYNAVFWGGLKVVDHQPHSRYFSRYPEGIEATVNWPDVNLVFRNDSSHNLVIKTEYTDTSVTVKLFGQNHGRAMSGEWRNQQGRQMVIAEGGAQAKVVTAEIAPRSRWTYPPQPLYVPNPTLDVEERRRRQPALYGWTTTVARTIRQGGEETTQTWRVKYLPMQAVIEVHPCVISRSCPRVEDEEDAAPGS